MDPQQRLLLECAYLAFLDAGYTKESLPGRNIGVFVGSAAGDENVFSVAGAHNAMLSSRISFVFGLQGPSAVYSTTCSSSLVALHAGVKCLQRDECDAAVVLGVNTLLSSRSHISLAIAGMLSESGRCHTFDSAADGYVRGEGCGAVVLKRMEVVSLERNQVHAVIRSVGVAQDGKSTSLMAPNGMAQKSLWRSTLKEAGLVGSDVDYLEAHGPGTFLGDYVEMTAVAGAL
jgi:acyl transferase domain-containing protein